MKIIILLICSILISCVTEEKKKDINKKENETVNSNKNIENSIIDKEIKSTDIVETIEEKFNWEKYEDSLRNQLLKSKPNNSLKSSILEELYIRGLVYQKEDKIIFKLPFDLHGFDCGAPDCYSTDITFDIPAKEPIEFPDKINFKLFEYGCIDNEISNDGIFELVEVSSEYINYYSKTNLSNLVIIKEENQLYYFPNVKPNTIKVKLIKNIIENYDDEDTNSIVPYQSTDMNRVGYELFMD